MTIKAPGFRLLVKVEDMERKTKGGIIIADTIADIHQKAGAIATVRDVGEGCWDGGEPWCKVGDKIVIARYGGYYLKEIVPGLDEDLRIINDEDVQAVIVEE